MTSNTIKQNGRRFLLVGATNFLWGLVSFPIFYFLFNPLGINYVAILIFVYVLNTFISFISQKKFVFRTKGNHFRELIKFALVQVLFLSINLLVLPIAVKITELSPVIVQTCFVIFLAGSSFLIHQFYTFKTNKKTD